MNKAGGILGILGGVFGFIAAIVTLFLGGIGSAFQANGSSTVIGLGWGGVLFSFLSIIFGSIAFAKPKGAGIGLIVFSVAGAFLGGTLVAICMGLSFVGGIIAFFGAKADAKVSDLATNTEAPQKGKDLKTFVSWVVGGVLVIVIAVLVISLGAQDQKTDKDESKNYNESSLISLSSGTPSSISPSGQLASIFQFGSEYTDVQRENALNEIKGKLVAWHLPVYEVDRNGEGYKIQTSGDSYIGTFVYISPRNNEERKFIESLRTGQMVKFRGIIKDSVMRNLVIDPAILDNSSNVSNTPSVDSENTQPSAPVSPTEVVQDTQTQIINPPPPSSSETDKNQNKIPLDVAALISKEEELNDKCRDNAPGFDFACAKRSVIFNKIMEKGWCWGPNDTDEADKSWIQCTAGEADLDPIISNTKGPSFDCSKAVKPDETLICRSQDLSLMDGIIGGYYRKLKLLFPPSSSHGKELLQTQRDFLRLRHQCGANQSCVEEVVAKRLNALQGCSLTSCDLQDWSD